METIINKEQLKVNREDHTAFTFIHSNVEKQAYVVLFYSEEERPIDYMIKFDNLKELRAFVKEQNLNYFEGDTEAVNGSHLKAV